MEFRQLEAFVLAYELKSFSKAAEELFLSQPSISAYISALEKEMNVQLFHRNNKEFVASKAGKVFYDYAREMLCCREKSLQKLKSLADDSVGNVDILASSVPAQFILPQILADYHALKPNVLFSVRYADSLDVIDAICLGKADVGFVGAKQSSVKCVFEPFFAEKLVLITPNKQAFLGRSALSLIREECFVVRDSASGTRIETEEFLRGIGVKPSELKVCACMNNSQAIISAVAGGLGIAIVSSLAAKNYIDSGLVAAVEIDAPPRQFYIVRKNEGNFPVVNAFLSFVKARGDN